MDEISKLKNGGYSVVDIRGVSVTNHFIDCLERDIDKLVEKHILTNDKLKQQLVKKDEEISKLKYALEWAKQDLNECAVGLEQKYKNIFLAKQTTMVKLM